MAVARQESGYSQESYTQESQFSEDEDEDYDSYYRLENFLQSGLSLSSLKWECILRQLQVNMLSTEQKITRSD